MAVKQPEKFDMWAQRWLVRWIDARPRTIAQAADVASQLAELPTEPSMFDSLGVACTERSTGPRA